MVLEKSIPNVPTQHEIRCFSILKNPNDKRFGEACGTLMMKTTKAGNAAGEVVCKSPHCKAKYEIENRRVVLVATYDRGSKKYKNLKGQENG